MLITRFPLSFLNAWCGDTRRGAVIHFPLAGYFAFAFWYAAYRLSYAVFSDNLISVCFSLAVVYFFFNMFHFDGFLDSVDGLLSQKPKEEALKIMKLGNIGPTALFSGTIYLLLKVYLAARLNIFAFLPIFVISRWGMSFSACISTPASETGLGSMIAYNEPLYFVLSSLYIVVLFFVQKPYIILVMANAVLLMDIVLVKAIEHRIGGLTGDNFGLINELNELLLMLTALSMVQKGFI